MSNLIVPRKIMEAETKDYGVCVWKMPDGTYITNTEGDYLCKQGRPGDKRIEQRMTDYVRGEFGITQGEPFWLPGFRKISQSEWEDEMQDLMDGHTPDPADLWRQANG